MENQIVTEFQVFGNAEVNGKKQPFLFAIFLLVWEHTGIFRLMPPDFTVSGSTMNKI